MEGELQEDICESFLKGSAHAVVDPPGDTTLELTLALPSVIGSPSHLGGVFQIAALA